MNLLVKPDYRRAEREALRILREVGVCEPPVDPVELARNLGVDVKFVRFEGESDKISGFYDCENNEIMVNKNEFPLRQTFTVAHELGHKVLHEEWARSSDYAMLLRDTSDSSSEVSDYREKEANAFAANLLMPRWMMDQYMRLPARDISRLFAVSVPAAQHRLAFLYGI